MAKIMMFYTFLSYQPFYVPPTYWLSYKQTQMIMEHSRLLRDLNKYLWVFKVNKYNKWNKGPEGNGRNKVCTVQSTSTWSKKISYYLALQTEIDPILRRGMQYWIFLEISLLYVVHVLEQSSLPVISGIRPLPSGVNRLLCIFNLFLLMCKTSELFAK